MFLLFLKYNHMIGLLIFNALILKYFLDCSIIPSFSFYFFRDRFLCVTSLAGLEIAP